MKNSKMLQLNWNDYTTSFCNSAKELMDDRDFMDVTLAFDDNEQIAANKFMLSLCSPFFRQIFKRNKHNHPLLYLKGIKSMNMKKMIDFIYHGEACVPEDDLETFLSNANELKLKGLTSSSQSSHSTCSQTNIEQENANGKIKLEQVNCSDQREGDFVNDYQTENEVMDEDDNIVIYNNPAEMFLDNSHQQQYDEETSKLFIEGNILSENGMYICKECGKEFSNKATLKNHMEIHMNNSYQCNLCLKTFGTKNSFNVHMSRSHKNTPRKK